MTMKKTNSVSYPWDQARRKTSTVMGSQPITIYQNYGVKAIFFIVLGQSINNYQNTDNHAEADLCGSHESEEAIYCQAAHEADAINVVKVNFATQQEERSKSETKSLKLIEYLRHIFTLHHLLHKGRHHFTADQFDWFGLSFS